MDNQNTLSRVNLRYLTIKGVSYFHREDVVKILLEFASTEETDTRNRLTRLVENLKVGK